MSGELLIINGLLYFIFGLIFFWFLFKFRSKRYHSRWHKTIGVLGCSANDFYSQFISELQALEVKNISLRFIYLKEEFTFFYRCKCLRICWDDVNYDLCVLNLGSRYLVAWRIKVKHHYWQALLYKIPFIGVYICTKLFPNSINKMDNATMFRKHAQFALVRIIESNSMSKKLIQLK